MAFPWISWKITSQVISCRWSYRLNDVQALALRGGGSSAWCTWRKFSPGALRRTWMFLRQGDFWRRQEGAGRGVHCQPFQPVSKTRAPSLQPSLFSSQLAFSAWLHRAHILYFRGMGWGGGNNFFFFLSSSTFLQVIGLLFLFPG